MNLLDKFARNDIPGRQDVLAMMLAAALMKRVATLAPSLAADAYEVSEAARRYYSDKLWRSEPGGALVLYSTMKKKLEAIKSRAEKRAWPV